VTLFDPGPAAPAAGTGTGSAEAAPPAPPATTTRLRLVVAYDGAGFRGFAAQPGQRTVAGELAAAIATVVGHAVEVVCAGRTDAGVHAWGQVVSLDVSAEADLDRLQRGLNKMLNPAIAVRAAAWAPDGFDARRSALSRRYRYRLSCAPWPDPLNASITWHVGQPLDLRGMQAAADVLLGEHDFASFCHAVRGRPGPLVRRVLRADWSGPEVAGPDIMWFDIEANAFCHQMVRSVVGTLVEVGAGRRKAGDLMAVLAARRRAAAGPIAPPHGLCLVEVVYPPPPSAP